jgi:hypothetical protein
MRIKLADTKLKLAGRYVRVKVSTPGETTPCTGKLTLKTASKLTVSSRKAIVTLGRATFSTRPGKSATVKVKLTRTGLRVARRARSLKVRIVVTARNRAGETGAMSKVMKLSGR